MSDASRIVEVRFTLRFDRRWFLALPLVVAAVGVPAALLASNVTGLTAFVNGNVADATAVNANFTAVKNAVDDNAARIAALEVPPRYLHMRMTGAYQSVSNGTVIAFNNALSTRGMTISGNGIQLKAGVTYRLEARVNFISASGANRYLGYAIFSGSTQLGDHAYSMDSATNTTYSFAAGALTFYTPSVDEVVTVKVVDQNIGTGQITPSYNTYFVATEVR